MMGERSDFTKEPAQVTRFPFNIYRYNVQVDACGYGSKDAEYRGVVNASSKEEARQMILDNFHQKHPHTNVTITSLRRGDQWFENKYGKDIHQKIVYTPQGLKLREGHTREEIRADVEKARQERRKK